MYVMCRCSATHQARISLRVEQQLNSLERAFGLGRLNCELIAWGWLSIKVFRIHVLYGPTLNFVTLHLPVTLGIKAASSWCTTSDIKNCIALAIDKRVTKCYFSKQYKLSMINGWQTCSTHKSIITDSVGQSQTNYIVCGHFNPSQREYN